MSEESSSVCSTCAYVHVLILMCRLDVWTPVFKKMQEEYGGVVGYVQSELGFTDEDVVKIKENLRSA